MLLLSPSDDAKIALTNLSRLIKTDVNPERFRSSIRILQGRFDIYVSTCPDPFIAKDLIVTPEIRRQSEHYLPIAEITRIFYRFYEYALTYPPVLSSTPFHKALSWADVLVSLPPRLQFSANPARLLEALLSDQGLMGEFLFLSFLPLRFYGGFKRYPKQAEFIREWLNNRKGAGSSLR
ncbi:MAG: hypothetical protein Q7W05_02155, partial [Deltaproteobacteria bacterium]|nr:hypothetical protein [Deltaproteobacteria bacterium]